jgi:putative intracellular protease/amidase
MTLSTIAHKAGPVSNEIPPFHMDGDMSKPPSSFGYMIHPATIATHTFWDAPKLDVVLVPGGFGSASLREHNDTAIETFLASRYSQVEYVMSVCTGAMHLAYAGILKGKKATTNKALWSWVVAPEQSGNGTADIDWQPVARWVENEKVWTSSGVQAGMDMTYAWLRHFYGDTDQVKSVMNGIEYAPHRKASWDPFAVVHDVPGTDKNRTVAGCVAPVGYEEACK